MRRSDFDYFLPPELIAQEPKERGKSRLLYLEGHEIRDLLFTDIVHLLRPGDLLVLNDTRVIPARLFGRKETGGKVEILIERILNAQEALAHVRASKAPKPESQILLEGGRRCTVLGRKEEFYHLRFEGELLKILDEIGHVPLPPYLKRPDRPEDRERYQTIFAHKPGAVAAPTAGLHFSEEILERLKQKGVEHTFVTLHVGAGTFQPVRVEEIEKHKMHRELFEVPEEAVEAILETKRRGGRVVAVGTTVVRTLETAALSGQLRPMRGETDLFIYPGFKFQVADLLLTNFHLPGSTLLMLVCAFGGYGNVMQAYRHAVEKRYRFFSYGDAMLVVKSEVGGERGE